MLPDPSTTPDLPQSFFADCRVLSSRLELLKAISSGGVAGEIGVADGDYSAEILRLNKPAKLHLIDAWAGERYSSGINRVQSRFAQQISVESVILHRGCSVDILPKLKRKSFDWFYLDASHEYADTTRELRLCAGLVKDGGRISGHDFCPGSPYTGSIYGVIQAVYEFCSEYGWGFEYITLDGDGHFSFCLKENK